MFFRRLYEKCQLIEVVMKKFVFFVVCFCLVLGGCANLQGESKIVEEKRVYKTVGDVRLNLHIFCPEESAKKPRAAIVFFFGGGWVGGTPEHFYPQSKYLVSRGMVAICAEYRVKKRDGTTPIECVKDGKSAVRWIRSHAEQLGIDPNKIAAGGGSAGGHVAACTAIVLGVEEEGEDLKISSVPNALVLFNPVVDTSRRWAKRIGERWKEISPVDHVRKGICPTIILHGTEDKVVPVEDVRRLRDNMEACGNICTLIEYEGMGHGFFNPGRHENIPYERTVQAMDGFLTERGYIKKRR